MDAIFVDGFPARITKEDFRRIHLQHFPKLTAQEYDDLIDNAIDDVYTMFHGVETLWDNHENQVWFDKTRMCMRLITAWYIADMYPRIATGQQTRGGIPGLKRKKIGGVDITFADADNKKYEDILGALNSNPHGAKAYTMIKSASKRVMLRNARFN